MAEAILVPQVGQDLTEATVVELHVKLGDTVKKGDLVAVVESEKASFEVEAFAEGVVINMPYKEGDVAEVLAPLMHLGQPGESLEGAAVSATQSSEAQAPVSAEQTTIAPAASAITAQAEAQGSTDGWRRSSPVARREAAARGLDLASIKGSGPGGAVVQKDVAAAIMASATAHRQGGGALAVRTLREGQGSPIICIHGFGADLSSWRGMVGTLPVGLPVMALDLPGHGASAHVGASSFAEIVACVGESLRDVAAGIHLVGHSLGAAVAAALTERGDLDVRSLTLLSPAGLGAKVDGDFIEGFLSAQSETALATWMRRLVHDPEKLAPVLVRATLAARDTPGLVAAQRRVAAAVFERSTQLFSLGRALDRFLGPCTVIVGRKDVILCMDEVAESVPANAALHRLPAVGHLPQVEAAELVQSLITRTVRAAG
ncbi:hypothetical protein DKT77_13800 [Meridianimarinicoccus roseus]|uniref:Acetoin dehydrogenase dihydrolipoyllysine-residue acetyltransferase subunit n=1 Tax=Meridianimarinicoccus roseus TaxID=2072018 RepID=A0A2V2L9H8_9RHOB|nr:alpha/beta fold hydrolase [Meridianimarinicoccus roseus]PWR02070.1 hypothetical protein DKT77_13800 [Meridianimarinicoccus roseus]